MIKKLSFEYLSYCLGLGVSILTAWLFFMLIVSIPQTSIIIFVVFMESAGTDAYFLLFLFLSIPSLLMFWVTMKLSVLKVSFGSVLICFALGHCILLFLIPSIAKPEITQLAGFLIFVAIALTGGFALVLFLQRFGASKPVNDLKTRLKSDTI